MKKKIVVVNIFHTTEFGHNIIIVVVIIFKIKRKVKKIYNEEGQKIKYIKIILLKQTEPEQIVKVESYSNS